MSTDEFEVIFSKLQAIEIELAGLRAQFQLGKWLIMVAIGLGTWVKIWLG